MKFLANLISWIVVSAIFLASIIYFATYWSDENFRHNAMGNLFATALGVIVGVPIGVAINNYQQKTSENKALKEKQLAEEKNLELLMSRVFAELHDNFERIKTLQSVLREAKSARKDLYDWAITIVDSFTLEAYTALVDSGLQELMTKDLEDKFYRANREINNLIHEVRRCAAALMFFYGYGGGASRADPEFEDLKMQVDKVIKVVNDVIVQLPPQS